LRRGERCEMLVAHGCISYADPVCWAVDGMPVSLIRSRASAVVDDEKRGDERQGELLEGELSR
jgi:hypothetical protein